MLRCRQPAAAAVMAHPADETRSVMPRRRSDMCASSGLRPCSYRSMSPDHVPPRRSAFTVASRLPTTQGKSLRRPVERQQQSVRQPIWRLDHRPDPCEPAESDEKGPTLAWTRITDPDQAAELLPVWFGTRMIGLRGSFGLLLTSGDILRITSVTALNESSSGAILLDVLLDSAGVPGGVDEAWRTKHYLGAPVPGATMATVNLAHVVAAVEFVVAEIAEPSNEKVLHQRDEVEPLPEAEPTALGVQKSPNSTAHSVDPLEAHAQRHVGKN
jgi:hypothetical protein